VRISRAEAALRIASGSVSERSDVGSLLNDCAALGGRLKGLVRAKALAAHKGPLGLQQPAFVKAPPPAAPPAPPEKPAAGAWPATLSFAATAKIGYWPEGEWFLTKMQRSGWGPDFLLTGWRGDVSFSIRARDLLKEVKSCELLVAVKLPSLFAPMAGTWRTYDVTWKPDRSFWNTSTRTWMAQERLEVDGPYEWTDRPKDGSAKPEAEAHVKSLTLLDGTVVTFQVPTFTSLR
jgi:hypothetical protein